MLFSHLDYARALGHPYEYIDVIRKKFADFGRGVEFRRLPRPGVEGDVIVFAGSPRRWGPLGWEQFPG
jgi:hypothetical protein